MYLSTDSTPKHNMCTNHQYIINNYYDYVFLIVAWIPIRTYVFNLCNVNTLYVLNHH